MRPWTYEPFIWCVILVALLEASHNIATVTATMEGMTPSGFTSNQILAREKAAAEGLGTESEVSLPIQAGDSAWKKLEALGVEFGDRVDRVLCKATLPAGWKIVPCDGNDPRHRDIVDADGKKIAYLFMKDSGYDYYGNMSVYDSHEEE